MMEGNFAEEWGESDYDDDEENEGEEGGEEAKMLEEEGEEDLSLLDELYCIACNKSFRNEKSMENHQRSKKHKENLEALKATMSVEDRLFLDQSMNNESLGNDLPPVEKSSKRKKKKNRKNTMPEDPQTSFKDEEDESITSSKDVKKDEISIDDNMKNLKLNPSEENDEASKVIPSANRLEETEEGVKVEERVEVDNGHVGDDGDSSDDEDESTKAKPKLKGKKAKDARKKAKEGMQAAQPDTTIHRCTVCENVYTSKNKLFTHIKKAGHAALKSASETKGREKKRQK